MKQEGKSKSEITPIAKFDIRSISSDKEEVRPITEEEIRIKPIIEEEIKLKSSDQKAVNGAIYKMIAAKIYEKCCMVSTTYRLIPFHKDAIKIYEKGCLDILKLDDNAVTFNTLKEYYNNVTQTISMIVNRDKSPQTDVTQWLKKAICESYEGTVEMAKIIKKLQWERKSPEKRHTMQFPKEPPQKINLKPAYSTRYCCKPPCNVI